MGFEPTWACARNILSVVRKTNSATRAYTKIFFNFLSLFFALCVNCKLWQLGQRILKFSIRLSCLLPFIWSNSRGSLPSLDFSAQLHISHSIFFNPSLKSRFFNLKLWYVLYPTSISSMGIWGLPIPRKPLFQALPLKWLILKLNSFM